MTPKRNAIHIEFKEEDADLYRFVIGQAAINHRSTAAQVRFYLEMIKSGKIKMEGIG